MGLAGLMGGSAGEQAHYCDKTCTWKSNQCDNFDTQMHFAEIVLFYLFYFFVYGAKGNRKNPCLPSGLGWFYAARRESSHMGP
jgi:hypothetical protein